MASQEVAMASPNVDMDLAAKLVMQNMVRA